MMHAQQWTQTAAGMRTTQGLCSEYRGSRPTCRKSGSGGLGQAPNLLLVVPRCDCNAGGRRPHFEMQSQVYTALPETLGHGSKYGN